MIKRAAARVTVQKLFFIDACGALLTTLMLLFVLIPFEDWFGMPVDILQILAGIAFVIMIFSSLCVIIRPRNFRLFLGLLAYANFFYANLTLILLLIYASEISGLGWLYFLGECAILIFLALVEYQKSKAVST